MVLRDIHSLGGSQSHCVFPCHKFCSKKGELAMPIPVNYTKPVRVSANESAYLPLQQRIIDGTLQPEEKWVDTDLAQAFRLSRTPIREARQRLEVQGSLAMSPAQAP